MTSDDLISATIVRTGVRFTWSTVEVTDVSMIFEKAPELIGELRLLKKDKEEEYIAAGEEDPELPYAFLSIVNLDLGFDLV